MVTDLDEFSEVLISSNPFYDWIEKNIRDIDYKLLKGIITNIVPLGGAGRKYFKKVAYKKTGFTLELWKLYTRLEKMYLEGNLKINSYLELEYLGYTGESMSEKYPVDDILKYIKNKA